MSVQTGRHAGAIVVGLLLSATALWIVLQAVDLAGTRDILSRAAPLPLVGIIGVVAAQLVIRATRWSYLLPTEQRIPAARLVPPLLIGYLGNAALPARLGEPMRAVVVARREPVGTTEAIGSVVLERIIDVATLAGVAFGAALFVGAPTWLVQALGLAALAGVGGLLILVTVGIQPLVALADRIGLKRRRTLRDIVTRLAATIGGPSRRRVIAIAAGISVVAWLLDAGTFWLAGIAVGTELSYAGAALIAGLTVLGTAIPSAPGYVGTFELAAVGAAMAIGIPATEALALAVVAHVFTLVPLALGGAASLAIIGSSFGDIARTAEANRDA